MSHMKKLIINLPRLGQGNWWVEIATTHPTCVYYFGPFADANEAAIMCPDYVQDLRQEGAQNIRTTIKRCHPAELTQWEEEKLIC